MLEALAALILPLLAPVIGTIVSGWRDPVRDVEEVEL